MKKSIILCLILTAIHIQTFAFNPKSPEGKWISIDSSSQKPTGIVEITASSGNLSGKIIEGFNVDKIQYCHNCPGSLNNTPVIGLTFLWGFIPDTMNTWTNGHILDPHTGRIYRGSIILADNGKKLLLRGYWGFFYRTQTWRRQEIQ